MHPAHGHRVIDARDGQLVSLRIIHAIPRTEQQAAQKSRHIRREDARCRLAELCAELPRPADGRSVPLRHCPRAPYRPDKPDALSGIIRVVLFLAAHQFCIAGDAVARLGLDGLILKIEHCPVLPSAVLHPHQHASAVARLARCLERHGLHRNDASIHIRKRTQKHALIQPAPEHPEPESQQRDRRPPRPRSPQEEREHAQQHRDPAEPPESPAQHEHHCQYRQHKPQREPAQLPHPPSSFLCFMPHLF